MRKIIQRACAVLLGLSIVGGAFAAANFSPLREHLAAKRAAIERQHDVTVLKLLARVTAESRSGVRRLRLSEFQLLSDSGRDFAGYSLGPGSWDTAVGILASAVADEFIIQAAARQIPLDSVDVIFTSHHDDPAVEKTRKVSYPRNLAYVAPIDSLASDAQLEALRASESHDIGHGDVVHTRSPGDPNLPPGLRDFLVEKRAAIERRKQRPQQPGYELQAHAHVEPKTGIRQIRTGEGFQFLHDSRAELGGYGLAPTVEEHQLGVLGTCLTHIYEIQAATRGVVLDSLELRLFADLTPRLESGAKQPPRYKNVRYSVHIESPATTQEIEQLRDAVEAICPVYNLLKDSQTIKGRVQRGRYAPPT